MVVLQINDLKKEDCEAILNAFEVGTIPPANYLPYVFSGRKMILNGLTNQFQNLINQRSKLEIAFINGERGQGKTMTSLTAVQYVLNVSETIIPIYIDLGKILSPVDLYRHIFISIISRAFSLIELNNPNTGQLYRLLESFTIDMNYHKLSPLKYPLPYSLFEELGNLIADLDGIICLIIDELDILSSDISLSIIDNAMEVFRIVNDIERLRKIWIFSSTASAQAIFQKSANEGIAFASRIIQAIRRTQQYSLGNLPPEEKQDLIKTTINIYLKAHEKIFSEKTIEDVILNSGVRFELPRLIIGNVISNITNFYDLEALWKKGQSQASNRFSAQEIGNKFDRIIKNKLFPLLSKINIITYFNSNPPSFPSLLQVNENKKVDGEISFPDGFKIFLEIKYSDSNAILTQSNINQLLSSLKGFENSIGCFLLFGNFSEKPISAEMEEWIKQCEIERERIKLFQISTRRELEAIIPIIVAADTTIDEKELISSTKWILSILGFDKFIDQLALEHRGKSTYTYPGSNDSSSAEIEIPLKKGTIKGLGPSYIKKLEEELKVTTVNQLVNLNPDLIATIPRVTPIKAKEWISDGNKLLEEKGMKKTLK